MVKIMGVDEAAGMIGDGVSIMVGGFGNVGNPKRLIDAIADSAVRELTVIANDLGTPNQGLGRWVTANKIKKAIGSYFTYNPEVAQSTGKD
jgi:acyl CoA:acetate/3-ketoacid CoA transferase alpha subunit